MTIDQILAELKTIQAHAQELKDYVVSQTLDRQASRILDGVTNLIINIEEGQG